MKAVLIGAGGRGRVYADYLFSDKGVEIAAVVEPHAGRRGSAMNALKVPEPLCFDSVEKLWEKGKIADAAIIASMDRDHYAQAMKAMELGYDLLLEKPISPSLEECLEIAQKAEALGRKVAVCHVLRFTPFFSKLKELVDKKVVGKIVSIRHEENIGNYHMAHSFVRGNWRKKAESSPIILQKSCHDMDILTWLVDSPAVSVSSVGRLSYFVKENAPEGAAKRCCDCNVKDCRFRAETAYLPVLGIWPATVVSLEQTEEALLEALKTGPYGRCVYHCDNDVCDNQSSLFVFENGVQASFVMSAFTNRICRTIRILCEDGEIEGCDGDNMIRITRFQKNGREGYSVEELHTAQTMSGHGGGDSALADELIQVISGEKADSRSSVARSVESHIMAFGAEESRLKGGEKIDLKAFRRR